MNTQPCAVDTPTAEQQARDMLEMMGVADAQSYTTGGLVWLGNLIAERDSLRLSHEKLLKSLQTIHPKADVWRMPNDELADYIERAILDAELL